MAYKYPDSPEAKAAKKITKQKQEEKKRLLREEYFKSHPELRPKAVTPEQEYKRWRKQMDKLSRQQKEEWETPEAKIARKRSFLKITYKISLEQYEQMLMLQNNLCLVCKEPLNLDVSGLDPKGAVMDHDHRCCAKSRSCGKCLRAIVHRNCNSGLGLFEDNAVKLRLAAEYLERFK